MKELVNHPGHYQSVGGEVIDIIERWGLGFCLGNALKYICRAGKKEGADRRTDLEKAQFYIRRALGNSEYCGPGTYKVRACYDDQVNGEMLPEPGEVADGYFLTENLEKAVSALYEYVMEFDRNYLKQMEEHISNELKGENEHE